MRRPPPRRELVEVAACVAFGLAIAVFLAAMAAVVAGAP